MSKPLSTSEELALFERVIPEDVVEAVDAALGYHGVWQCAEAEGNNEDIAELFNCARIARHELLRAISKLLIVKD